MLIQHMHLKLRHQLVGFLGRQVEVQEMVGMGKDLVKIQPVALTLPTVATMLLMRIRDCLATPEIVSIIYS